MVEAACRALDLLPAGAPASAVFDAIRPCVPLAAGIFCIIRPDAPDALMSHASRLPWEVFESWLATSIAQLARTLAPIVSSRAGDLWRDSQTITGAQREELEVLSKLDVAGLGEGAGYKILERATPWSGPEHYMLALLMERGQAVPERAQAMLAALNPAIQAAVLRIGLMLVARSSILTQIVEDDLNGYVCISRSGEVIEANRRAHDLVMRYRDAAGVHGQRRVITDFAMRAREMTGKQRTWQLVAPTPNALLEVKAYQLAKESHALPEDVVLVMLKEAAMYQHPLLGELTERQREIALLLVRTGDSYKQIAVKLGLSEGTVRTHVEAIYSRLGVHSRAELVTLLR
jgi:DNA-binding CsgD family transcriptional regulator